MKKYLGYIIGLSLSAILFIVTMILFLAIPTKVQTGEVSQSKLSKKDKENMVMAHRSYEVNGINIYQKDFNHYDLEITIHDENDNLYDDVLIYCSKMEDDLTDQNKVNFEIVDNKYVAKDFYIESRGDYFLTIKFKDKEKEESAVMPLTFPKMNPKIYINHDMNNLMFEIDGKTSWSSFIDPEGINLYRSSNYLFDEKAHLIEENLRIIEYQYLDVNTTPDEPYYFIKLSGKEGRVNFLTRCLFGKVEQKDTRARFLNDPISNKTYLELTGSIKGPEKDNEKATRDLRLRVGNWPDTQMVENSYKGDDNSRYKFLIDILDDKLVKTGSNDMVIFYTENGTMLEASIDAKDFDINGVELITEGKKIYLSRPNALAIQKEFNLTYQNLKAEFLEEKGKVYLVFSGTIYNKDPKKVKEISLYIQNLGSTKARPKLDGSFEIKVDLENLVPSGHWNDLRFTFKEGTETFSNIDLKRSIIELGEPLIIDSLTYEFENWQDQLKLHKHY